jgi:uncharacterized membrane protein
LALSTHSEWQFMVFVSAVLLIGILLGRFTR